MAEFDRILSGLSILLLDDEVPLARRIAAHLQALGADVTIASTLAGARQLISQLEFDFALLDIQLPDGQGLDLLREQVVPKNTGTIIMTAMGGVETAVEAMRLGALDFLLKPFEPAILALVMSRARRSRQTSRAVEHQEEQGPDLLFTPALRSLSENLEKIINADRRLQNRLPPVLITGETGTGKSSLARWLHRRGPRFDRPFIEVNCSALPDSLAESELFGHERGAFTDARTSRQGLFEAAHTGTLFLDELPSLSPALQAKVLMALEDRRIRRLGGTREIEVDVRIVAATNRDLRDAVKEGVFREDLLHRLDLYRIHVPPLRERGEDLVLLANHLLKALCRRHRLPPREITPAGKKRLLLHNWPGNVRELSHELERSLIFGDNSALNFEQLSGQPPSDPGKCQDWLNAGFRFPEQGFQLDTAVHRLVQLALQQAQGNVSRAARMLGVTRDFMRYHLQVERKVDVLPEGGCPERGL